MGQPQRLPSTVPRDCRRRVRRRGAALRVLPAEERAEWPRALRGFEERLHWHCHFIQKLEDAPWLEQHCLHPAYAGLPEHDPARLAAWVEGRTGWPFVDACMRSLAATGWLNFRMRAMVMAVASYHLRLDWRHSGAAGRCGCF